MPVAEGVLAGAAMHSPTLRSSPMSPTLAFPRELAIARSLLSVLQGSLASSDVESAAALAEQLAEQLRRIAERRH